MEPGGAGMTEEFRGDVRSVRRVSRICPMQSTGMNCYNSIRPEVRELYTCICSWTMMCMFLRFPIMCLQNVIKNSRVFILVVQCI